MSVKIKTRRTYPWLTDVGGQEFTFRLMSSADRDAMLAFTKTLNADDPIFLRMDIRKPKVVNEWLAECDSGRAIVLLAMDGDGNVVGYAALHTNELLWTRHQAELRLFVTSVLRGIGLGKRLCTEAIELAEEQEFDMVVVNIPREQPHIRQMLEHAGFSVDALLTDWVIDQNDRTHDLIVMSYRTKEF